MKAAQRFVFSAIMLASVAALPAYAACVDPVNQEGVHLQQQQQNGINYVSGGIGQDESCAIQKMRGYNLHITFSAGPENKYESGIKVAIQGAQGHEVLNVSDVGPILLAQLPAGKYVIVAQLDGREMRSTVDLSSGKMQALNVHWRESSASKMQP
ncbi:hypothetical protein [Pseudomonas sp. TE3610]